ncbi:MAG: EVE domain-containing protein [Parcubacteria group bacterium RIFOXYD2_FULL_52_8]|nr:MAG: EVE domain-containing protein [Parcubacteria group bacterium RIFOXYD2_FULL_52_8]
MNHWLMKTDVGDYSIDDLKRDKKTAWVGVRNYQARNYMRDQMQVGDLIFFYHSIADPSGIAGVAKVASKPYPDPTQFDKKSKYYDPKATKEKPIWFLVDIAFVKKFKRFVSLEEIKVNPKLAGIMVAQKGCRLSVQPVSAEHFKVIESLGLA